MRRRSVFGGVLAALAAVLFLRRRSSVPEHVDLYYSDGSMMSLEAGDEGAARMLATAREGLAAARS